MTCLNSGGSLPSVHKEGILISAHSDAAMMSMCRCRGSSLNDRNGGLFLVVGGQDLLMPSTSFLMFFGDRNLFKNDRNFNRISMVMEVLVMLSF